MIIDTEELKAKLGWEEEFSDYYVTELMIRQRQESNLRKVLKHVLPNAKKEEIYLLVKALTDLVDTEVKHAKDDLEDRVDQRGVYDPEY